MTGTQSGSSLSGCGARSELFAPGPESESEPEPEPEPGACEDLSDPPQGEKCGPLCMGFSTAASCEIALTAKASVDAEGFVSVQACSGLCGPSCAGVPFEDHRVCAMGRLGAGHVIGWCDVTSAAMIVKRLDAFGSSDALRRRVRGRVSAVSGGRRSAQAQRRKDRGRLSHFQTRERLTQAQRFRAFEREQASAWWCSLGINVVFGRPAHPQDNGAHERMHGDMALELERDAAHDAKSQQRSCDVWVHEFNHVRPHEALEMRTPAELYARSTRPYRGPRAPRYPISYDVRRVFKNGSVKFERRDVYVGAGFAGQLVGFERIDE